MVFFQKMNSFLIKPDSSPFLLIFFSDTGVLIVFATVSLALISVLAAIGICERCRVESGGVYFLIAHTLGSRFGGSLGLLYCFGQAVGCALNVLGWY